MSDLAGCHVLVVEDDYMIACDVADMLQAAGAIVVGPIGREQEALAAASDPGLPLDLALLDVDLRGVASYGIADALAARGVPVVFTTGFSADAIDPAYRSVPRLEKPVSARALLIALQAARRTFGRPGL